MNIMRANRDLFYDLASYSVIFAALALLVACGPPAPAIIAVDDGSASLPYRKFSANDGPIHIDGVLNNDIVNDPNQSTTMTISQQPEGGTAAVDGNTITYTPNGSRFGSDKFQYAVNGGPLSTTTAFVYLELTGGGITGGGITAELDKYTVLAGRNATLDVLINDLPGKSSMVIDSVSNPQAIITRDGKQISITPFESNTFTYTASANGNQATASVELTVFPSVLAVFENNTDEKVTFSLGEFTPVDVAPNNQQFDRLPHSANPNSFVTIIATTDSSKKSDTKSAIIMGSQRIVFSIQNGNANLEIFQFVD